MKRRGRSCSLLEKGCKNSIELTGHRMAKGAMCEDRMRPECFFPVDPLVSETTAGGDTREGSSPDSSKEEISRHETSLKEFDLSKGRFPCYLK